MPASRLASTTVRAVPTAAAGSDQNNIGVIRAIGFNLPAVAAAEGFAKLRIDVIDFLFYPIQGLHVLLAKLDKSRADTVTAAPHETMPGINLGLGGCVFSTDR